MRLGGNMPYKINWEKNGVVVRFSGIFDYEVNKNANCEIYEDSQCNSINYAIWDTSGVSEVVLIESEFNKLAMQDNIGSDRLPKLKMAILAQNNDIHRFFKQYINTYHNRLTGWDFMVSDNMEDIKSWIGL
jgi:hypothetical protein